MNRLSPEVQAQIAALLVEGTGSRKAARILGVTLNTILRNALWIGEACERFHNERVHGLKTTRIEADEMWTFVGAKDWMVPEELKGDPDCGTKWTWISVDPDHKFIINWWVGGHSPVDAAMFIDDLARRVPGTDIQITTDQLKHYRPAIESAFGSRVHYATVLKEMHGPTFTPDLHHQQRHIRHTEKTVVFGDPKRHFITTTTSESFNARVRAWNSRYVRDTLGFSKRLRNLRASFALHATYTNWCRINPSIRCTPAMQIGLTDHIWEIEELLEQIRVEDGRSRRYLNAKKPFGPPAPKVDEDVPYSW